MTNIVNNTVIDVIDVNITLNPQLTVVENLGTLLFLTSETNLTPDNRVVEVYSIDELTSTYGLTLQSDTYLNVASAYSQEIKPVSFEIGKYFTSDQAATLTTGLIEPTLSTWQAITDGQFKITIDSVEIEAVGIDFSLITQIQDVATAIDTALGVAATATYDNGKIVIISATTGDTSTITFISDSELIGTNLTTLLAASQAQGAVKSNGSTFTSIVDELDKIRQQSTKGYFLITGSELRDTQDQLDIAAYVETGSENSKMVYVADTNDPLTVEAVGQDTTNAWYVNNSNLSRTKFIWHNDPSKYTAAAAAQYMAGQTNFNVSNGTITLDLKQLAGITTTGIGSGKLALLRSINANTVVRQQGRDVFKYGTMANGRYLDTIYGTDALEAEMQIAIYNIFLVSKKIQYTTSGLDRIENGISSTLDRFITNGFLSAGENEGALDLPAKPYSISRIPVQQVPEAERQARQYNYFKFSATLNGAISSTKVNGNLGF